MNRSENLWNILRALLDERPEYASLQIPDSLTERQGLMRSLLNVRPPLPVGRELLEAQDAELRMQLADKGIVHLSQIEPCRSDGRLRIWQGDVTRLQVDAIVNAANSALLGCFVPLHRCIDNAIHTYAGMQLRLACAELMERQGHEEPTGQAKLTPAYNLPCRYVLHTVGPIVSGRLTERDCALLQRCYQSCLTLAAAQGLESVAFCCISTGEFHFPNDRAAEIAVGTVREFLKQEASIKKVIFNVFKDCDREIYERLLQAAGTAEKGA